MKCNRFQGKSLLIEHHCAPTVCSDDKQFHQKVNFIISDAVWQVNFSIFQALSYLLLCRDNPLHTVLLLFRVSLFPQHTNAVDFPICPGSSTLRRMGSGTLLLSPLETSAERAKTALDCAFLPPYTFSSYKPCQTLAFLPFRLSLIQPLCHSLSL